MIKMSSSVRQAVWNNQSIDYKARHEHRIDLYEMTEARKKEFDSFAIPMTETSCDLLQHDSRDR